MIKVVSTSLILIALFGTSPRAFSQNAVAAANQAASEEALNRQARLIELRKDLTEAQALRAKGDVVGASKEYEKAWESVERVGPTADIERAETIKGLAETRLELAHRAQAKGDLDEASKQVARVLRVDPQNQEAQDFKAKNDKLVLDRVGKEPSKEALARLPEVKQEQTQTAILVQDARLLMEMGKLDEAEAKLKLAIKQDPENRPAFYYMSLIKERRFNQEARKREMSVKNSIVEVESAWNMPVQRDTLPMANIYATTNRIYTSAGRQAIFRKLNGIILEKYEVPGDLELSEVIKDLFRIARERDVDKTGVNFITSSFLDKPGPVTAAGFGPGGFGGAAPIDPLTGQPVAQAQAAPVKVEDYRVTIDPPLLNVRLIDVLDAITRVAKPPEGGNQDVGIKYSIEDYAVVFSQKAIEAEPLYTRTYKVDPNTFVQGLDGVYLTQNPFVQYAGSIGAAGGAGGAGGAVGGGAGGVTAGSTAGTTVGPGGYFTFIGNTGAAGTAGGGGGAVGGGQTSGSGGGILGVTITNAMSQVQIAVAQFFIAAGIDFVTNQVGFAGGGGAGIGGPTPPRKAIFFNDRTGVLFVRATLKDLDIIEGALQALNIAPPQVSIETRIAEITQRDNKAVGFDWFLGNVLLGGGQAGVQGGTAPSFADSSSTANPAGTFPNPALPRSPTDGLITSGLTSNAGIPAVATVSGILTDPQFRVVIRALEQREGVDLLSAPKITTLSGRQARISIEDTQTIIIGFSVTGLGGGATVGGTTGGVGGTTAGAVGGGFQ
jgi:tetratricopeptide (TPR) repeat protein